MRVAPGLPSASLTVKLMWAVTAALLLVALAGCAAPLPWVKPYEREHFADPIMSFNRDPISSTYLQHVFETREGARGATGSVGGGCGCN
jgi:hypothetical protein